MREKLFIAIFILLTAFSNLSTGGEIHFVSNVPGFIFYEYEPLIISVIIKDDLMKADNLKYNISDTSNAQIFIKETILRDALSTYTLSLELPNLKPGYYTLNVSAIKSNSILSSDFVKIAVIRKTNESDLASSPIAVDAFLSWRFEKPDDIKLASEIIRKAGIRWVRDRIDWGHVEPSKDKWDFSKYEYKQKIQRDAGLTTLQIFHGTAPWASENKKAENSVKSRFAPENLFDLYSFLNKSVSFFKDGVDAWEMWNEFDLPFFFLGTADEYAEVMKTSYLAIKQTNPGKKALFGSVTFGTGLLTWGNDSYLDEEGERYIEKVFENGTAEYFDIFNVHHYGPVAGVVDKIRRCKSLMKKFNCEKPIWLTEIGSVSTEKMKSEIDAGEKEQAEYLAKAYILAMSEGVEKIFYFSFALFIEHGKSFWGIVEPNENKWQPKPGYAAQANILNTFSGMKFKGAYKHPDKWVNSFVFSTERKTILAAWSDNNASSTVEFKLNFDKNIQSDKIVIRNLYGHEEPFDAGKLSGNKISVILNKAPLFVIFNSAGVFSNNQVSVDENMAWNPPHTITNNITAEKIVLSSRFSPAELHYDSKYIDGKICIYSFSDNSVNGELVITREIAGTKNEIFRNKCAVDPRSRKFIDWKCDIPDDIKNAVARNGKELAFYSEFIP